MGFIKGFGKVGKYIVWDGPLHVLGVNHNKKMFLWLRGFWTRASNPVCPECDHGVMVCRSEGGPTNPEKGKNETLYVWACSNCQFAMLAPKNATQARKIVMGMFSAKARVQFDAMDQATRQRQAHGHKISSRIFFGTSAIALASAIYLLSTGTAVMVSLNWMAFAFMFWVFGMKRSYRAWQVSEGLIFREGLFWRWFKHEKWLT